MNQETQSLNLRTPKHTLQPVTEELERFYDYLNQRFCLNLPHNVVITIQTTGRRNAKGWFCLGIWNDEQKQDVHEINLCSEYLQDEPYHTLAHEIAHFMELKEKGKLSKGNYHGKTFKNCAEKLGLNVEKGRYGWCKTNETEEFNNLLNEFGTKKEVFKLLRKNKKATKQPTRMKKFACGCTIVRCATELGAECWLCGMKFERCM